MKVFFDLDTLFFFESMRDNITLAWVIRPDASFFMVTCSRNHPDYSTRRTLIALNMRIVTDPSVSLHEVSISRSCS